MVEENVRETPWRAFILVREFYSKMSMCLHSGTLATPLLTSRLKSVCRLLVIRPAVSLLEMISYRTSWERFVLIHWIPPSRWRWVGAEWVKCGRNITESIKTQSKAFYGSLVFHFALQDKLSVYFWRRQKHLKCPSRYRPIARVSRPIAAVSWNSGHYNNSAPAIFNTIS